MDVNVTGAYVYFTVPVFGGIAITQTTVSVFFVTVLLMIAGVCLGRNLTLHPGKRQTLTEMGVLMLHKLVCDTMGSHNAHWTPYIGTVFLSSLCGSLIGMTGFLRSSTADLSVPLVWAVMTTGIIWYSNIKNKGFLGWLKGFSEPVWVMTPMNIVSEIAQPISMAFRHFGNVAGGGVITAILYTALGLLSSVLLRHLALTFLIPAGVAVLGMVLLGRKKLFPRIAGAAFTAVGVLGVLQHTGVLENVPVFQLGIPAVLSVYFDLFSGFVQAFVFSLLSMVYIAGACPEQTQT